MSNHNASSTAKASIRLLLGVLFIITALLKLFSIDNFELYIYSFGIFGYTAVTFLSRLLISIELFLGLSLILKIHYQKIWWITVFTVAAFTDFLIYTAIFRNDRNCHCFGSLIELDPLQSIIKNIIILGLLFVVRKEESLSYRPLLRKWLFGLSIAVSLIISFVMLPMDVIYNKIYSDEENVNTVAFYESMDDSKYNEGRYLINYALAGCSHCRFGVEKLTLMLDRHQIPHDRVKFVIGGSDEAISKFVESTGIEGYDHWKIPSSEFMSITFGKFPLFVFIEDGKIVKAGDFRILDDETVLELF